MLSGFPIALDHLFLLCPGSYKSKVPWLLTLWSLPLVRQMYTGTDGILSSLFIEVVQVYHPGQRLVLAVWGGGGKKGVIWIQQEENTGR